MPPYFAYGSNLDRTAMAVRCPAPRLLGRARLSGHRFFIMVGGYASIRPEPKACVHGLLWNLAAADGPALDDYEEVDAGLYRRVMLPVEAASGTVEALVYQGLRETAGASRPGYMEAIVAAAKACGLPPEHCAELRGWLPRDR